MNQIALYKVLKDAGCKILSFEDYPENLGSWRASFLYNEASCEVISNRYDAYLILTSTSLQKGIRKNIINKDPTTLTDNFELVLLSNWIELTL